MRRSLAAFGAALAVGCAMSVEVDPEGYRCDTGGECPHGYVCVDEVCRRAGDVCAGVSCEASSPYCEGDTLRVPRARCDGASGAPVCLEDVESVRCARCAAGACVDDTRCEGVVCDAPPAVVCADTVTLRAWASTGSCVDGACSYASNDVACPGGCADGVCRGADLCAQKSCDTPPAPTCAESARREYQAHGRCDPTSGQCAYDFVDMPCDVGCARGQCIPREAAFTQVGPGVRFPIRAIDQASNSGGALVAAVGDGGRLAWWNGAVWAEVGGASQARLEAVRFVTGTLAYVAGADGTLWAWRPGTGSVTPLTPPGAAGIDFVDVAGRAENDVLVVSGTGAFWRLASGSWAQGKLPTANAPYVITSAFIDEVGHERVGGSCKNGSCVAFRSAATGSWRVDTMGDQLGVTAVGGGFTQPTAVSGEALTARGPGTLAEHSNYGFFTQLQASLSGARVVGIAAQHTTAGGASRQVYVLTSPGGGQVGQLARLAKSLPGVPLSVTPALDLTFPRVMLGPTEATGVIVAEASAAGGNNVFRRSVQVDQALDVGEDLAGASYDDAGGLVLVGASGVVAVRAAGAATFVFRRAPQPVVIESLEARRGTGTLVAGRLVGGPGVVYQVAAGAFIEVGTTPGVQWNAVCRVSDAEGWVVGSGGAIASVTSQGLLRVPSPTTADLLALDCGPGYAIAAGRQGVVVQRVGGAWVTQPSFPGGGAVTGIGRTPTGVVYAAGGAFARFEGGQWVTLPDVPGLTRLVVRGDNDVYGAGTQGTVTALSRFDGLRWGAPIMKLSGGLRGGVHVGGKVVWGGTAGAVVVGQ